MAELERRIGIIGGGQLGKMMILEAKKMAIYVAILDPTPNCPAHSIADKHIVGDFHDEKALRQLAEITDAVTYEFEHIDVEVLRKLNNEGYAVYPSPESLAVIQNKYTQKLALQKAGLYVPDFCAIEDVNDLLRAGETLGYPFLIKTCTEGYDGKGNFLVKEKEAAEYAYQLFGQRSIPLMAEAFVPFLKEISVLACRGISGEIAVYPVGENTHHNNILIETKVPAYLSDNVTNKALQTAHRVMEVFEGVGMFCIEMFVTQTGEILINEIAPRPHNSGHYSIEGCVTSQFEQHIRAVLNLPLGKTTLLRPTAMRNLLGSEGYAGKALITGAYKALALPGVKVHIYGKEVTKPQRKMGHITATAESIEQAAGLAEEAAKCIQIISHKEV